jgi:hypothetical protein
MRSRTLRSALALALALCFGLVPMLHAGHRHEPCHRGLHVAPPHDARPAPEGCAACRTSHVPGAAPAPASSTLTVLRDGTPFVPIATRGMSDTVRPASPPRAPPSLSSTRP